MSIKRCIEICESISAEDLEGFSDTDQLDELYAISHNTNTPLKTLEKLSADSWHYGILYNVATHQNVSIELLDKFSHLDSPSLMCAVAANHKSTTEILNTVFQKSQTINFIDLVYLNFQQSLLHNPNTSDEVKMLIILEKNG